MDGFALGIEDAFFEGDVDLSFHRHAFIASQIIRQAEAGAAPVLLIGGIQQGHSLRCGRVGNSIKRGQLFIEFSEGLLQHLAEARTLGGIQLSGDALTGEEQALVLAVPFLLALGETRMG